MNRLKFPLCSNQLDIWYDQRLYPNSPVYNIGGAIRIDGEVDFKLLRQAIKLLVAETDSLQLLFVQDNFQLYQIIGKENWPEMDFIDFSNQDKPTKRIEAWLENAFQQPFNLDGHHYLYHYALLKESSNCYHLMGKYHHLISDGLSSKIASDRIAEHYNNLLEKQGCRENQENKTVSYTDFILLENEYSTSKAKIRDAEYWAKQITKLPFPLIDIKYQDNKTQQSSLPQANFCRFHLEHGFYQKLQNFSEKFKSSSYHMILVVLSVYFARINKREEILLGVPSLNRNGARFKQVLGMFIGLSPLLLRLSKGMTTRELLAQCASTLRQLYRHQRFPLGEINQRLELMRHKRDTLFDIVVSYERQEYASTYGSAPIHGYQLFSGVARYPLAVTICEFHQNQGAEIVLEGAVSAFTKEELNRLGERFKSLLKQVIHNVDLPVEKFDLLTEEDRSQISEGFNSIVPADEFDHAQKSFLALFKSQLIDRPDAVSLEYKKEQWSYSKLDMHSNQLAHLLLEQKTYPDSIVAICLPRSSEMIIAILAILKAGAAYLPIDPDLPVARIKKLLQQTQASAVITTNGLQTKLESFGPKCLVFEQLYLEEYPTDWPNVRIDERQLAYIIYTSGSSGEPKGVAIEHHAMANRLACLQDIFSIKPGERFGQNIAYNFDPSIIEIFLPLSVGATLVLAPPNCQSANDMAEFVVAKQINALALVPSSLYNLMQGLKGFDNHSLRVVCSGGETLSPKLAHDFILHTGTSLFNVYGPTEAAVLSSFWHCDKESVLALGAVGVPIGKPLNNTAIYIVDSDYKLLPPGVNGEIVIAGAGLARGYIADEALTENKFPTVSLADYDSIRIYKTGDRGFIGTNGLLYFSGRGDRQVKISGYRIEPGEIESVLIRHKLVERAVVKVVNKDANKKLMAYIESKYNDIQALIAELSDMLRKQLPVYMQPLGILALENFPVTSTGKIDLSALPSSLNEYKTNHVDAQTTVEKQILLLWQDILEQKKIGIHDNFFSLGGDSLAAVKLACQLDKIARNKQSISFILEYPTIFEQARELSFPQQESVCSMLTALNKRDNQKPDFFLMASGHGDAIRFSQLAKEINGNCNLYMLQPDMIETNTTIESLAKDYAQLILQQNSRPEYIGGFSIGGITALETASILEKQGYPLKNVFLLDSVFPRWPLKSMFLRLILPVIAKLFFFNKIVINGRRLDVMLADRGIQVQLKSLQKHQIKIYSGRVVLLKSNGMWPKDWFFSPWKRLFGPNLTQYDIPGLHGGVFKPPYLKTLADTIGRCLKTYR